MISVLIGKSSCGISQGKIISIKWLLCYRFFLSYEMLQSLFIWYLITNIISSKNTIMLDSYFLFNDIQEIQGYIFKYNEQPQFMIWNAVKWLKYTHVILPKTINVYSHNQNNIPSPEIKQMISVQNLEKIDIFSRKVDISSIK